MNWVQRALGMDWFDLIVHFGVTGTLMGVVGVSGGPEELFPGLAGLSLVVLAVRRRYALRRVERPGLSTGEMAAERLEELEQRMADLEGAHARVAELEERLEFAERMLLRAAKGVEES